MNPVLIGIAGASGSGKSTLAHALQNSSSTPEAGVLSMDHYYHGLPEGISADAYNFDHPSALDISRLSADLQILKKNQPVIIPQYDFKTHKRHPEGLSFAPLPLIIIEGIFLFTSEQLCAQLDCRIFLDVPENVCLQRRIQRDMAVRGRSEESIRQQVVNQVEPMFHRYVLPTIDRADLTMTPPDMNSPNFNKEIAALWHNACRIF